MKKIVVSLVLGLICSAWFTSVVAISNNYIYMRYTGSSYVVGSYANTVESVTYDNITIFNYLYIGGVNANSNHKVCLNTTTCQTNEITYPYYSSSSYYSESGHRGWINNDLILYSSIIKYL